MPRSHTQQQTSLTSTESAQVSALLDLFPGLFSRQRLAAVLEQHNGSVEAAAAHLLDATLDDDNGAAALAAQTHGEGPCVIQPETSTSFVTHKSAANRAVESGRRPGGKAATALPGAQHQADGPTTLLAGRRAGVQVRPEAGHGLMPPCGPGTRASTRMMMSHTGMQRAGPCHRERDRNYRSHTPPRCRCCPMHCMHVPCMGRMGATPAMHP